MWDELTQIPFAETISYKTLALRLGDIKLVRAVGLANGRNPLSIVIPCHRVIGADGTLVGYGGGLEQALAARPRGCRLRPAPGDRLSRPSGHQVESNVPGRATGGSSRDGRRERVTGGGDRGAG